MDRAIVGVCFDSRQRRILDNTLPWRRYEERHGIPVRVVERDYAGGDSYWNKHLLFRNPELRSFKYLMFLDNDVFANAEAEPLLNEWDSPLIGCSLLSESAGRRYGVAAQICDPDDPGVWRVFSLGRLATCRYLNMDQVIGEALDFAKLFLQSLPRNKRASPCSQPALPNEYGT